MLYLKSKIVAVCFLFSLLFVACNNNETTITNTKAISVDSTNLISVKKFTILLSGMIPPPMYSNALDILGNVYNIDFVYAAGCIVDESIGDSISKFNNKTFADLDKFYKRDLSNSLYAQLDKETYFLNGLDSIIRNKESIKKTYEVADKSIYYTKKDKHYFAHFISSKPDGKILTYKLNLIMTIDSATKNITGTTLKDSLIDYNFRNLSAHD